MSCQGYGKKEDRLGGGLFACNRCFGDACTCKRERAQRLHLSFLFFPTIHHQPQSRCLGVFELGARTVREKLLALITAYLLNCALADLLGEREVLGG